MASRFNKPPERSLNQKKRIAGQLDFYLESKGEIRRKINDFRVKISKLSPEWLVFEMNLGEANGSHSLIFDKDFNLISINKENKEGEIEIHPNQQTEYSESEATLVGIAIEIAEKVLATFIQRDLS